MRCTPNAASLFRIFPKADSHFHTALKSKQSAERELYTDAKDVVSAERPPSADRSKLYKRREMYAERCLTVPQLSKVADSVSDSPQPVVSPKDAAAAVSRAGKSSTRRNNRSHASADSSDSDQEPSSTDRSKRRWIRPPTFDGTSQSFAAFRAHFENAASFNKWRSDAQLAHLKSCLTSVAAQTLWDTPKEQTNTLHKLWKLLDDRFGGRNVGERY